MNQGNREKVEALLGTAGNPEVAASALEAAASAGAACEPGFLTVLCARKEAASEAQAKGFAEAAGLDVYTARQRLSSPVPRPLRRDGTERESAKWVKLLRGLGLRAFTASEREISETEFLPCTAIFKDAGHLIVRSGAGDKHIAFAEFCGIACGEVASQVVESRVQDRLAGEAITQRNVSRTSEFIIDLAMRGQPRIIRLRQSTFDFARVMPAETSASSVQIRAILKMIRKALPGAPVYDQFAVAEGLLVSDGAERLSATSDAARRGIASGMAVHRNMREERTALPTFDLYSTLARFEVLRGA
ncbi:hypothetical protein IT571_08395 [Candidatus Sumerlaeota bacterium]|nr:hypothetical protein [Candidatus Sumerlaeota bacterium]